MSRRATALGLISSVVLTFSAAMAESPQSSAQAADVGGYVVGAGLGLLLGAVLWRNQYGLSPSYYNGGGSSSNARQYQPKVVYGWYSDGFTSTYGPIMVPPPGYVQPQTTLPANTSVTGTIINPATGMPVTGTLINAQPAGAAPATSVTTNSGAPLTTPAATPTGSPITTPVSPVTTPVSPITTPSNPIAASPDGSTGTLTAANINAAASGSQRVSSFGHAFTNHLSSGMGHSFGHLQSNFGTHLISHAVSTAHTSAVHAAMQRVSRGSIGMIGRQAGRHLGRMF